MGLRTLEPDTHGLPLNSWAILDVFHNLSGLSFLSCKMGVITFTTKRSEDC